MFRDSITYLTLGFVAPGFSRFQHLLGVYVDGLGIFSSALPKSASVEAHIVHELLH